MKEFKVVITEISKMDVYVEAEDAAEAEEKVSEGWNHGDYILDADNFEEANFEATEVESDDVPKWARYLQYLKEWAENHSDKAFVGCCPVCFDEWLEYEGAEAEK